MTLYCGIDLHSNNCYVAIRDEKGHWVGNQRLPNNLPRILEFLTPFHPELEAVAVESTYNWYWLVDGLKAESYDVRLVNTSKAKTYSGLKKTDDPDDARWIADLLALGILPEGYIMPPPERALRDLLRRRSFLVDQRTSLVLSLKALITRSTGASCSAKAAQSLDAAQIRSVVGGPELVAESIISMRPVVNVLNRQIKAIETKVLKTAQLKKEFELLKTTPGIGQILSLTIMCETGDIKRFASAGNYVSYCRCAKTERISNSKKKGSGNRKNGNKYLSWAYSEAAHHCQAYEPRAKRWVERKRKRSHPMVASRALAAKLARACYYVLRDQVPFDASRAFK